MKRILILVLLFSSIHAVAQKKPSFRLNLYAAYAFDDAVDSYYSNTSYYDGKINGGLQWGLGLEFMLNREQGIELSYLREDTKAPITYYDGSYPLNPVRSQDFDVAINYIMIGSTRYFPVHPKVEPYIGAHLGMAIVDVTNPEKNKSDNATKFAWAIKGGTNIWASEKVGIKLGLGIASIAQGAGGGIYFGTGGVSTGVTTYSTIYQFTLGGGLVFKFGGGK